MVPVPELRVFVLRALLARLAARWPDDLPAVRAVLGPDALGRIERAPPAEWLPIAWAVAVDRVLLERGGEARVREVGRESSLAAVADGLLAHLAVATLGMLGRRPQVLLRLALAGYRVATRNAGDNELLPGPGADEVRIRFLDAPELVHDPAFLLWLSGAVEGLFAHAGVPAEAAVAPGGVRVCWSGAGAGRATPRAAAGGRG